MKMKTAIIFLLMLGLSRCKVKDNFEQEMVILGNTVTLTCPRDTSWLSTELFWIRIVSGNLPEILGGTYSFDYDSVNKTPHHTTKQENKSFVLIINKTEPSDTGLYFCVKKQNQLQLTILKGTLLKVKGPQPDVAAIVQDISPDPVHPGDIMTLQCSALFDSEKKTCPGNHSVFWWRSGPDESYPRVIYTYGNRRDECEESREAQSPQECVYSFSKTVSSSDSGTYYCVVNICGQMLFGHGTKIDVKDSDWWSFEWKRYIILCLLCGTLVISVIVMVLLVYSIKSSRCDEDAVFLQKNLEKMNPKREEDMWVYSAVIFTMMTTGSGTMRDKNQDRERIYAAVKAFGLD